MKKIYEYSTSPAISDKPSSEGVKAKHQPATPLPWRVSPSLPAEVQQESGIHTIGIMGMDGAVNARYIAHAANAYPKLVEALREIETINDESAGDCRRRMGTRRGNSIVVARDLLRELGEDA